VTRRAVSDDDDGVHVYQVKYISVQKTATYASCSGSALYCCRMLKKWSRTKEENQENNWAAKEPTCLCIVNYSLRSKVVVL
jgi:hypothetical protein